MADCCNCCNSTNNLGCIDPCGIQWVSGVSVPVGLAGVWTLYIEFNRKRLKFDNDLAEGQQINFAVGCINPYYKYKAYITKPDGSVAQFTIGGTVYDCFELSTQLNSAPGVALNASAVA